MANKINFKRGDVGDFYEPSDSDEEYTQREKSLLQKVRTSNKNPTDREDEIMAFDDDGDEDDDAEQDDDDQDLDENSDFEEEDRRADGGIPDSRAWGKKRRDFYSTDFVDADYSSYTVNEEQMADQEEEEARAIQQRLAKQLDEADFSLDVYASPAATAPAKKSASDDPSAVTHLKSDLSGMSHRQLTQLFRKDSPEFDGLVQDFEQRLQHSHDVLEPIVQHFQHTGLAKLPIFDFVTTKNQLILTYCSNVAFYLVLKAKRISIKNHPLAKRLVQMRQLLLQLEDKYERVVRPQLERMLQCIGAGEELVFGGGGDDVAKKSSKLKLLTAMEGNGEADESVDEDDDVEKNSVDVKKTGSDSSDEEEDGGQSDDADEEQEQMGEDDERRQITYQISKNKGLTPYRKKELRNPRVKHRNKFRKALIRRKGAVRTIRKEDKRYGGEISGIKASTKKGIKIK